MNERPALLNALRAFEAAARHLSFKKAAAELHVTPAAISQHVKGLEEYLGVPLFHRGNRSLVLSPSAAAAIPSLRNGFDALAEAVRLLRDRKRQTLKVWAPPSFAAKWLVPKLRRFATLQPEVSLEISASESLIGEMPSQEAIADHFRENAVDVAIAFGSGEYPGFRVEKLLDVEAVTLCSPRLLSDASRPLRAPTDLRHHTLLHDETDYPHRPDWARWLAAAKIDGVDASRGLRFNQMSLALDAAIDGQGVVLSLRPLAAHDIESGRLVIPFDLSLPLQYAYYLVSPEETPNRKLVDALRDWLLEEARRVAAAD